MTLTLTILAFVVYVVAHLLICGLCVAARTGDAEMERWIEDWRKRESK